MSDYTTRQKEYIDSVEGEAHMSAVKIIGELDIENQKLKEADKIVQDYIRARIKVIESRASRKDWEVYGDAWDALRKLKHE